VRSADVRMLWLENSYHVATLDADKELIAQRIGEFINDISRR
jgi:carboxylesterase